MRKTALALAACAAMAAAAPAAAQQVDMIEAAAMLALANKECGTSFSDARIEAFAKMGAAGKGIYGDDAILDAVASQYAFLQVQLETQGNRDLFCSRAADMAASFGD